jgi:hypothetical protein
MTPKIVLPLTERYKIVKTLENDSFLAEMFTVTGIFYPVPCHGLFGVRGASDSDVLNTFVDPLF